MNSKIFVYSDYYKPGYLAGGPVQSVYNMCNLVADFSFYIYTQNFDADTQSQPYQLPVNTWLPGSSSQIFYTTKWYYRFLSYKQLYKIKPDVIYFNSLFATATQSNLVQSGFYALFNKCKIIIAPRGELDDGALSIKSTKKKLYISLFRLIANSKIVLQATTEKEKQFIAKRLKNKIIVAEDIPVVLDERVIKAKAADSSEFIFISRICPKKNLLYALQCLQKVNISGRLHFTITGPFEDKPYWEKCEKLIGTLPATIKCTVTGPVQHYDIGKMLINKHYLLFPTMAENFGHVIYESLINSLPVIISNNTPWDDGEENGVFAYPLDNEDVFIKQIEKLHALNKQQYDSISKNAFDYAKNKVNFNLIKKQYCNLFN
jgi:glycosyltransferase involved in cell wall biosynthesis